MRDSFKLFDCIEGVQETPLEYTFTDDETLELNIIDIARYLQRRMLKVPSVTDSVLSWLDPYQSLAANFSNFNDKTKDNFTRIKDALEEEYNVLDNYNGQIDSTMTDTYNKSDTQSFTNRQDTRTLNNTDTHNYTNVQDQMTYNSTDTLSFTNRVDTHSIDSNDPKTTETTHEGTTRTENYVAGYNTPTPAIESATNVINGYNSDPVTDTTTESGTETDTKSGSESQAKSGTDTNVRTGAESDVHSGTITDAKSGSETMAQSGTITHVYSETKSGNLGVTTSQQMLSAELELRLNNQLKDLILNAFIDEYTYY